ncbi:MAG: hypothetical protein H6673_06380 [Anaerolineales bacterium]|nr:hypothetical protein [Anaerolineales bacterium]
MIATIRSYFDQAFKTGLTLGAGFIFLTLIGLPSDGSEALASITVPLFLLLTLYLGWRLAKRLPTQQVVQQVVVLGLVAVVMLLLFLGLINRWHAKGINVANLYFANMNTYPMHVLSGVPEDELFANPKPNPVTGEYIEDVVLRTNPMALYTQDKYALLSLGPLHVGGFYGLGLLIVLAALVGGGGNILIQRVNWRAYWEKQASTRLEVSGVGRYLTLVTHWFMLTLPFLIFLLLWLTVEHRQPLGRETNLQVINLNKVLKLTSESLVNGQSLQLGIGFMVVVFAVVAVRRATLSSTILPYSARVGIPLAVLAVVGILTFIRLQGNNLSFIAPSFAGTQSGDWLLKLGPFELQFTSSAAHVTSLGIAGVVLIGLAIYIFYANYRQPEQFETIYVGSMAAAVVLAMPLFMDQYQTFILGKVGLAAMFGLGLNIVVGYAGLLDLGYVAFYAIGAYTFAFLAVESEQFKLTSNGVNTIGWTVLTATVVAPVIIFLVLPSWRKVIPAASSTVEPKPQDALLTKVPIWSNQPPALVAVVLVAVVVAVSFAVQALGVAIGLFDVDRFSAFIITLMIAPMVGAFAGILLGFPVLRLRGDYLAIVTLGFGEIISLALKNLDKTTGGPSGALGIPKPIPNGTSIQVGNLVLMYLSFVGIGLVFYVSSRLRQSRVGRAWLAIRSDEDIAQAMGINLVNLKLLAFSIGAAIASLAGMIYASRQNSIFPDDFTLEISINVLSLVIIGGMGSLPGVIVGSIVLIGLPELLRPIQDYRIMVFGLLLIVTMVVRREGLMPAPPPSLEDLARRYADEETQV